MKQRIPDPKTNSYQVGDVVEFKFRNLPYSCRGKIIDLDFHPYGDSYVFVEFPESDGGSAAGVGQYAEYSRSGEAMKPFEIAILTTNCLACGAAKGVKCSSPKSGKPFTSAIHKVRRQDAAFWRKRNAERWRALRQG